MHWAPLFVLLSAPTAPRQQAIAEALAFSYLPALERDQQMLYAALAADESVRTAGLQDQAAARRGETQALTEVTALLETAIQPGAVIEEDNWPVLARHIQVVDALGDFARRVRQHAMMEAGEHFATRERGLLEGVVQLLRAACRKPKNQYLSKEEVQETPELYTMLQQHSLLQHVLREVPSSPAQIDTSHEDE